MTTPNKDFNMNWDFKEDQLRDRDHKFEFTEEQGKKWGQELADKYNYEFAWEPIGKDFEAKIKGEVVEKKLDVPATQGFIFRKKEVKNEN